ncbi:MAG: Fe-S-containing hydro-lyase [Clostridia bacterium]|jgi:fumarate hydratase subunit beta|nr:Fe-S-containing hydro-lyase [Clostridia bacterium]MDD4571737.1 Fe-S-containing hydro-lyase [Clostridia bacterium]
MVSLKDNNSFKKLKTAQGQVKTIPLTTPVDQEFLLSLKVGDVVKISGTVYTGRDAAHKNMTEALAKGEKLPMDIEGQIIYYVGPAPAKHGAVIGSCGPTTAFRMDPYTPQLLEAGLKVMIGKGPRSPYVVEAMKKHGAIYLAAVGGAAATISKSVKKAEIIAYEELGPEAIYKFEVQDLVCFVAVDAHGNDLYEEGRAKYSLEN